MTDSEAVVRCPSCGANNVRVVGQTAPVATPAQQPPVMTRNYQCIDCFHRWAVTAPAPGGAPPAGK